VLGKNCGEVKGKSESALFRHLGEEFSNLKNKSRIFLREHLKTWSLKKFSVLPPLLKGWEGKGTEASAQRTNAQMLLSSVHVTFTRISHDMTHWLVSYDPIYLLVHDDSISVACPMFYVFCVTFTTMSPGISGSLCDISLHVMMSLSLSMFTWDMS
jgi:hypothetical protein